MPRLLSWNLLFTATIAMSGMKTEAAKSLIEMHTSGYLPDKWQPVKHQTSLGVIEGRLEEAVGRGRIVDQYYAFRGIPYAKSPTGDLRLAEPVDAVEKWPTGYLNASKFGSVCPQIDPGTLRVFGNENCLFLNIFTPSLPGTDSKDTNGLPVLVFFHGGGFLRGSSSSLHGGRIAGQKVILVTMNFRMGALGFLSTGDEVIPGNYGVLDQVSALRWIQRNIKEFGGDPGKVTVGGYSAGAGSAHFHMLSPRSKGLFRSTFMVSGGAFCSWSFQRDPELTLKIFSQKINCPTKSKDLKKCLTTRSTEDILRAQGSMLRYDLWPFPFAPVIDKGLRKEPFFPAPLKRLIPEPLPALMGEVSNEGIFFSSSHLLRSGHIGNTSAAYEQLVRDVVSSLWMEPGEAADAAAAVETFYYSNAAKTSINVLFEEMSEAMMDFMFHSPIAYGATTLAKAGSPVYMYLFTHRDEETPIRAEHQYKTARESLGITSPLLRTKMSHGDNLAFLFGTEDFVHHKDEDVSQVFLSHLASFVYTGTPSVPKDEWPALGAEGPILFYNICAVPHMEKRPFRQKELNFWLQTMPFILKERDIEGRGNGQDHMPLVIGAIIGYVLIQIIKRYQ